ncbi:DKNYY domain-containing protein [Tenacibaculum caenipelagi]|uniref:DKNYY family protein n=1 Tax=Tenacibaculum caenipelagi TaxID=1325435 RepID=A0A4R6TFS0_9FLAO|nr:DKNYY domain-containing protein [Tenacibaculum caenipelagi]TDQ27519.1 DKNYY family protein [Tenacibaculum caenipelagi]
MNFITNHPYISIIIIIFILNSIIKKITRAKHSPIAKVFLFFIAIISQACSPFAGPVDKSVSDSYYYSKSKSNICYSPMGNWFELGNTKLNADVKSFKVLGREFGKDKNHVYYKSHIIDNEVDIATFYVDKDNYICFDKNNVYVAFNYLPYDFNKANQEKNHLWKVAKANPETFQKIDYDWSKDDNHFFYNYVPIDADYTSFKVLNENFAKDKNKVYSLKTYELLPALTIDPATTKKINDRYIADKNNIYDFQEYQNSELVDSLISIPHQNIDDLKILEDKFLLFDNNVIYDGVKIKNVDVSSFQIIQFPYSKDKNHVFYYGDIIEKADPKTFSILETSFYAKDKNHVFVYGKLLKEADVATFGPTNEKHSLLHKDKNHTYRGDEIVEGY